MRKFPIPWVARFAAAILAGKPLAESVRRRLVSARATNQGERMNRMIAKKVLAAALAIKFEELDKSLEKVVAEAAAKEPT